MKREDIFKNMDEIREKTWYRQRFDACPHFLFFVGIGHTTTIQHTKYPFGQKIAYAGYSKNRCDWYHCLEELEKTASMIIEAAKHNPNISKDMIAEFQEYEDLFYEKCLNLKSMNLSKLSNGDLLDIYKELADIYTKKLSASPLIDGFALTTDTLLSSKLQSLLDKKGLADKFSDYFTILTGPVFISFFHEEEIAFLHMAEDIKKNPTIKDKKLKEHQEKYFWYQNNYVKDHVLDINYFTERLEEESNYQEKIESIELRPKKNLKKKEELISELGIPKDLQVLINITDDFNAWQDERKKSTFWATHYFSLLLEEISNRTSYTLEELKYSVPPEIDLVVQEKIPRKELQQRFDYCMIGQVFEGYDITTDISLIKELDAIGTGKKAHTEELKGFTASLGKAEGTVKIIESAEEIGKVEEGDILVAVMTRPDYLPAMKKAAAFVTDEGGVTCHAAIVAREMKKPCVIGTKIGTKILKDGDLVEVNADKGIVRKL
ncbi:PEP-utilizing enzyme [Nanoarchaeota archaeon]